MTGSPSNRSSCAEAARKSGVKVSASPYPDTPEGRMSWQLQEAERKAWDSLARYKFQMFGYWAAIWVHLNRISDAKLPNPFGELVAEARDQREQMFPDLECRFNCAGSLVLRTISTPDLREPSSEDGTDRRATKTP